MTDLDGGHVRDAAQRLAGVANRTPVMTSRTLDRRAGRRFFLKCENFQRAGAFKFRGAYNAISQLSTDEKGRGVITHSSGNHAQGVALAARLLAVPAVVVMPHNAPAVKREATEGYGARIVPCRAEERETVTERLIAEHDYVLVHPYDDERIIAGQGTAAWELFAEVGELDALFVPVGGGGLISGSALAAAELAPGCRVIGVEPEQAADANESWRTGQVVTLRQAPDTIADGLRTRYVGEYNLAIMRRLVSDMATVSEAEIVQALTFVWQRMKIIIEPSAAVPLAAAIRSDPALDDKRIGVLLSGGNVDIQNMPQILAQADRPKTDRE